MNKTNSEILKDIADMRAKMHMLRGELDARTSAHEACIKQLRSTQEQLNHTKNLYDAELVFHQKVTDALVDERAAHAKTRARLDGITNGTFIANINCKKYRIENDDGYTVSEGDIVNDGEFVFQPLPSTVKFAEAPAVEKKKRASDER